MSTAVAHVLVRPPDLAVPLRSQAAKSEADRTLSTAVVSALVLAGLSKMCVPKAFGGTDMEPHASLDLMAERACIDASMGWFVTNSNLASTACQFLPSAAVEELPGDPGAAIWGSFVSPGTARAVGDRYVLSGSWCFGSGIDHSTTLLTPKVLIDASGPAALAHFRRSAGVPDPTDAAR